MVEREKYFKSILKLLNTFLIFFLNNDLLCNHDFNNVLRFYFYRFANQVNK